jgi:hypothetical protein
MDVCRRYHFDGLVQCGKNLIDMLSDKRWPYGGTITKRGHHYLALLSAGHEKHINQASSSNKEVSEDAPSFHQNLMILPQARLVAVWNEEDASSPTKEMRHLEEHI